MVQRRPTNRLIRHVLFWAGVNLFFFIGFYSQPEVYPFNPTPFLVELFFASLLTFLFYTYLLIYGLLPLLFRGAYGWFAVGLLGLNIVASMLYDALGYVQQFIQHRIGYDSPRFVHTIEFTNPFLSPIFIESNLVAGLMVGSRIFNQWQQKQQESQRFEREKLQTELKLLKLQLNPDFLFGSLRALHTLAQQRSTLAPEVVLKLAHFLRYVLYESQTDRMPLLREIEMIEHFVSLQRCIHPAGLEVSFSVRGNPGNWTVAPLLLFQLVGHAFHDLPVMGADPQTDEPAWVSIDLAVTETQLTLKVIDGQSGNLTDSSNQLAAIHKQLYFHYADSYDLQEHAEPDAYIVTLTLPFVVSALSPSGQRSTSQASPDYETTLPTR